MAGLDEIRNQMTEFLRSQGLNAVTAWPEAGRKKCRGVAAAVSIRTCEGGPGGFQDYLGERYSQESGRWEEIYGRRIKITFGLDLYAGRTAAGGESTLRRAFDTLTEALHTKGPEGLRVLELSAGEVEYRQEYELFHCPAEAVCEAYLYAVADEGGAFLDFEIRGVKQ